MKAGGRWPKAASAPLGHLGECRISSGFSDRAAPAVAVTVMLRSAGRMCFSMRMVAGMVRVLMAAAAVMATAVVELFAAAAATAA